MLSDSWLQVSASVHTSMIRIPMWTVYYCWFFGLFLSLLFAFICCGLIGVFCFDCFLLADRQNLFSNMVQCAISGCNSNNNKKLNRNKIENSENIKFFRFPKDESQAQKWVQKCARKDAINVKNAYICCKHFLPEHYNRNLQHELLQYCPKNSKKLRDDAVPTENLPLRAVAEEECVEHTRWESKQIIIDETPSKEVVFESVHSNEKEQLEKLVGENTRMMPYHCCVNGCNNTSNKFSNRGNYYEGKFVKFPVNPERCKKWNAALNLECSDTKKKYVCSQHFPESAWRQQDVIMNVPITKRKLKPDAEPTLNSRKITNASVERQRGGQDAKVVDCIRQNYNNNNTLDEMTRQLLVAEAMAEYERDIQKGSYPRKARGNPHIFHNPIESLGRQKYEHMHSSCTMENAVPSMEFLEAEIPVENCNFFTNQTMKCGEILVDVDAHTFALNCFLCSGTYASLDNFIDHIHVYHKSILNPQSHKETMQSNYDSDATITNVETEVDNRETGGAFNNDFANTEQQMDHFVVPQRCKRTATSKINKVATTTVINPTDMHLYNEPLMDQIIFHYKHCPVLWDKSHPFHANSIQRKNAIVTILNDLHTNFPELRLTYKTLSELLLRIRIAYRCDLRHKHSPEMANSGNYSPKYWFFDKLEFLGNDDPKTQLPINEENLDDFKKIASQPPFDLYDSQKEAAAVELIELYEQQPCLWSIHNPHYKGKLKNNDKLYELFNSIQQKYPDLEIRTLKQLKEQLNTFNNWFSAEEHIRQQAQKDNMPYVSRYPRFYMALEFLQGHVSPFCCEICQHYFPTEDAYRKHTSEKSTGCAGRLKGIVHPCEYCGKRFPKPSNLKQHIRMHTNERPYECKECGKKFRNYATCFRHGRTHTKNKPFKCNECERCYYTSSMLRLHQKSHLGIRDKVCDICGKAFTQAKYLYRHREVHVEKPSFNCDLCARPFKTHAALHAHRKRCGVRKLKRRGIKASAKPELFKTIV